MIGIKIIGGINNSRMEKEKRKILYISGTRADYGLMKETLFSVQRCPGISVEIAATGMHLMKEFGSTIKEIKKDGFKVHRFLATYQKDNRISMAKFIGLFIDQLSKKISRIKPDIILIMGDRAEMLGAAVVGVYAGIPVAHVHGGDISSTVDEISRHAITKLSHIHFPATKKSAQRIVKMGENLSRVFIAGAPGLDEILNDELCAPETLEKKYSLNFSQPVLMVLQHPATSGEDAPNQMKETMEAILETGCQTMVIYPNSDAGGRKMIKVIENYRKYPFIKIFKNLDRKDFLSLMKFSRVLIGNSSSGIIEAPLFHLPVINLGERQEGRERSENIIDTVCKKNEIIKAIKTVLSDKAFLKKIKRCGSPYGNGFAGVKIAQVLAHIPINQALLQKKIIY
jgi:UDP-hydrolysing UDP-N-acetyl-D-glucosamine 2-epimerase